MKRMTLSVVIVLSFVLFSFSNSWAQSSASATAPVTATIQQGLTITLASGTKIDFGTIATTGAQQTPSVTPASGANFVVTGQASTPVTVTYSNVSLTDGGSNTMDFTPNVEYTSGSTYSSGTAIASNSSCNLSSGGDVYLWVGGQLTVAANQAAGAYTGTFQVTVAY